MGKRLYVGNLPYSTTSSDLEALFKAHGAVVSAEVVADRDTGRSKGFGFVEMGTDDEAKAAIAALDGQDNGGRARPLGIPYAVPPRGCRYDRIDRRKGLSHEGAPVRIVVHHEDCVFVGGSLHDIHFD